MKTNKEILSFFNVKVNKTYKILGESRCGVPHYFRIIEKCEKGQKKLIVQTKHDYPESPYEWGFCHEESIDFLTSVDFELAPIKPITRQERMYFNQIFMPLKHEILFVIKRGEKDKEWIEIHTRPEDDYEEEAVSLFKFKKGSEYKGMKKNTKYTLKDLEIDQPYGAYKR